MRHLHNDACAALANAAALAGLAASVVNWLWLDDGDGGRSAARHVDCLQGGAQSSATAQNGRIVFRALSPDEDNQELRLTGVFDFYLKNR